MEVPTLEELAAGKMCPQCAAVTQEYLSHTEHKEGVARKMGETWDSAPDGAARWHAGAKAGTKTGMGPGAHAVPGEPDCNDQAFTAASRFRQTSWRSGSWARGLSMSSTGDGGRARTGTRWGSVGVLGGSGSFSTSTTSRERRGDPLGSCHWITSGSSGSQSSSREQGSPLRQGGQARRRAGAPWARRQNDEAFASPRGGAGRLWRGVCSPCNSPRRLGAETGAQSILARTEDVRLTCEATEGGRGEQIAQVGPALAGNPTRSDG